MNAMDSTGEEKVVLLTGGAGVFGKKLADRLIVQPDVHSIMLVRATSDTDARERFKNDSAIYENAEIYRTDLSKDYLDVDEPVYTRLTNTVTHILHAAASTRFNLPLEEARACNVETTRHMLEFATQCKKLKRFVHISTALVAGKRSGVILESEFEHGAGFLNTYQQSKYEAEVLAHSYAKKIPAVIFRVPLLIGQFKKDSSKPTNVLTLSIFLARRGLLPLLPGTMESTLDIMDGGIVSDLAVQLLLKDTLRYAAYHITSGGNTLTVGDIVRYLEEHMGGKKLSFTFTGNLNFFEQALKKATAHNPALHLVYHKTRTFLPELAYPKVYDNKRVLEELKLDDINHNAQDTLKIILS